MMWVFGVRLEGKVRLQGGYIDLHGEDEPLI